MSWVAPSGCNSVYKLNRGLQSFHLGLWNRLISRSFLTNDHQHQYVTIYFYCGLIYWSINNCSYTFTPLTSIKNLRKWQLILKAIGPLELAIHVVQNRHDGEQKLHWDKTNKGDYHLKLFMPFVCLVPVRLLLSSTVVLYHGMASCKGPITVQ